jgi:SAM-dependent methyltransferase
MRDKLKQIVIKYRIKPILGLVYLFRSLHRRIKYNIEYFREIKRLSDNRFNYGWFLRWPCLNDATKTTGFDAHYVYHTAWAARLLAENAPGFHVDISSYLYFASLVSAFIPVRFYDYRPAPLNLTNIECGHADVTNLPFSDNSIDSLSCMHVMEHIGLGRYGDPFDPKGDIKGINELKRVVAPGGHLYFVVPIGGKAVLQFNAHRIYTYKQVVEFFDGFELISFSLVCDDGTFLNQPRNQEIANEQRYGCGCFLFKKTN